MTKVQLEYGTWSNITRMVIIYATHVDVSNINGLFEISTIDVSGEKYTANSTDDSLETVYVDEKVKYVKTMKRSV